MQTMTIELNNKKNKLRLSSDVETSLDATLVESNLKKLGEQIGDIALDQFLEGEVLKDIPVLGLLVKMGDVAKSLSGLMLQKKLLYFLQNISNISPEKRGEQILKINCDPKYQAKVGESILLMIEKHDSYERPILLAKAFRAFLLEEISYDTFLDLAYVIDKIRLSSLNEIKSNFGKRSWNIDQRSDNNNHFESLGLISRVFVVPSPQSLSSRMIARGSDQPSQEYILNEFAKEIKLEYKGNRLGDIFVRSVLS
jgi:hypothetical protein